KEPVSREDVLVSLGFSKDENPFELSKLIINKNGPGAAKLVDALLSAGEEPLFLLNVISSCIVKILKVRRLVKAGADRERIFSEAGLNSYYDKDFIKQTEKFAGESALFSAMEKALSAEYALKTSSAEPALALKSVIAQATK
ncbi:MAG: hypothetical protein NTW04_05860, partial [Elusimicrobia bacterium]|nr:hypothetical protein [Elusimicrobiota bacterium]